MANEVALGVDSINDIEAKIRTVPPVSPNHQSTEPPTPSTGAPYAEMSDLANCAGLALGSPTHFGNMAAPLKYFLDQSTSLWQSGSLINTPAGCFTSTTSLHGGQETTLLSMMLPLLHHGAILVGVPYSETHLFTTQSGGSPYGPSHTSGSNNATHLTEDEKTICRTLGARLATTALKQLR